ncbi:ribosome biogenesis GTPase [Natranaerovirga hydrolytica]|uniref:Small ribosomal subunit biogenesis GTPase RsgA n=1 Tax=Natranaerovirga hydrolytica TaxID=680378 RepID=A0A4V2Q1N9_9FIRM|nr:ribosome small subunit-dependent GTPase A [Natranaerovirga hydrolytica]TCK98331.1 ribosome biogenesis GTPase [Natranaerovirga hydrolytica]
MKGKIIKGIAGFYYVHTSKDCVYECKAKGIFRNKKIKPLVGDNVIIEILEDNEKLGNIIEILERKNDLIRPLVANVDQVLIVFSIKDPDPNLNLLDHFIVAMEQKGLDITICFNKMDLINEKEKQDIIDIYQQVGYNVITTSTLEEDGLEHIKKILKDKTTVLAGPSGVGKSSILNALQDTVQMEIGEISQKIKRGKHTTRHAELIAFDETSYLVDTPGFSSIHINELEPEDLKHYYIEFLDYQDQCKFNSCVHINEPQCGVKKGLENKAISQRRYNSYLLLHQELKDKRRW